MPGVDGFTLKVDALYKVSVVRIEVEYQFTLKVTKRRMTSSLQWQFLFIAFLLAGLFIVVKLTIVQPLSPVELLVTPWTAARKASLSFSISQSSPKIMSIDLVMPSNHLILCVLFFCLQSFPASGSWLPWWLRQERIGLPYRRPGFDPWVGKIPWRREWQPTPVFLPGKFQGQRSLADYSPQGRKQSDMTEQLTYSPQIFSSIQ